MALKDLKSDLSWYGKKKPGPYKPNADHNDTKFTNDNGIPGATVTGYAPRGNSSVGFRQVAAGDKFLIDNVSFSDRGSASRKAQLGVGTKFPIGPSGEVHSFDIVRTGFNDSAKYGEVYSASSNKGLADTYTKDSPIDDMYNKFNLRDDATPQLGYINHPLILRGIQRKGSSDPQRWGLGNTIAGKLSSTFDIPRSGILTAIERGAVDVVRIAKFFASPKGLSWGIKQFGLQLTGPNTEGTDGTVRKPLGKNSPKLWMPTSTLLSPLVAQAGMHLRRTGLLPADIPGLEPHNYEDVILSREGDGIINDNRLIKLKNELLPIPEPPKDSILPAAPSFISNLLGFKGMPIKTLSGKTGPDSLLGIGSTNINRFANTSLKDQLTFKTFNGGLGGLEYEKYLETYNTFESPYLNVKDQSETIRTSGAIGSDDNDADEDEKSLKSKWDENLNSPTEKLGPDRGGRGILLPGGGISQASEGEKRRDYKRMAYGDIPTRTPFIGNKDERVINHTDFREIVNSNLNEGAKKRWGDDVKIDDLDLAIDTSLVKFNIAGISFKAYIGSINDSFAGAWNGQADQGRADARYLYESFERTITLDFIVPIESKDDYGTVWGNLQKLAQKTYPVYGTEGFHGQTVKVTVGDLYKNQSMIITDLSYDWDNETPWEITEGEQSPMYTNVSISFTVLGSKPNSSTKVYQIKGI